VVEPDDFVQGPDPQSGQMPSIVCIVECKTEELDIAVWIDFGGFSFLLTQNELRRGPFYT